jgi:hypothetical protein
MIKLKKNLLLNEEIKEKNKDKKPKENKNFILMDKIEKIN